MSEKNIVAHHGRAKIALITLVVLALTGVVVVSILRDAIVNDPQYQVSVTGRGKVAYTPNEARVSLGYNVTKADDAAKAVSELNEKMTAILAAVENAGVAKDKITTQSYNVSPIIDYSANSSGVPNGYQASQLVTVVISEVDVNPGRVAAVLDGASKAGANQVTSVTFGIADIEVLKKEAVNLAIANAKVRATELEKQLDLELGDIVGWWENAIYVPDQLTNYGYGGGGMPTVPQGNNELVMDVNINYDLEN